MSKIVHWTHHLRGEHAEWPMGLECLEWYPHSHMLLGLKHQTQIAMIIEEIREGQAK